MHVENQLETTKISAERFVEIQKLKVESNHSILKRKSALVK